MRPAIILSIIIVGVLLCGAIPTSEETENSKPYGIAERIPWTTSRVVGTPDPPLPYHVQKTFSKLQLTNPVYIEGEPGTDHLLVVQQNGKIFRFESQSDVETTELLLDPGRETYGLTFHPDYAQNGYLYIVTNGTDAAGERSNRVSRFTVERQPPYRYVPESETIIIEWKSNGHNGGDLAFGLDGFLYITAGDGTSDSDGWLSGQDLSNLNGTLIRIDVNHQDEGRAYSIPADNPFLHLETARPEIWAYGFRNPWRVTVDERLGHIWVGNVGQDQWETVHLAGRGENYGWSVYEGGHPFYLKRQRGPTPIVKPTVEHPHSEARSITGGVVYYGWEFPELRGAYIYGDYSTGKIWGLRHDGANITLHKELADTTLQIVGFGVDKDDDILIVDHQNAIYRLEWGQRNQQTTTFPTLLSETGLFTSVEGHQTVPALIPYSVNSPLWSDAAHKERFIALPSDSKIAFTPDRGWNFPDGTVLVKTFSLDLEDGNPASRHRIETRLLTQQQSEWVGYSYAWNDAQTDATLVQKTGVDRTFTIQDSRASTGKREQTWHYPSRAECMVCHSRATNFVLGLTTLQMNKVHDYGRVADNQLRTLSHIGAFTEPLPNPPEEYGKLVNPYDPQAPLDARARSYLHANCAQCHIGAGGGNALMELEFTTAPDSTNIFRVAPQHTTFGIADAMLIAPGNPDQSIVYQRLLRRGPDQMPPLATSMVDDEAVKLLREWIAEMEPNP